MEKKLRNVLLFVLLATVLLCCSLIGFSGCSERGCDHHNVRTDRQEPTCTAAGKEEKICIDCDALLEKNTLPALGHDRDMEGKVRTEATCTSEGVKIYTCKRCNAILETEPISRLPHTKDDGKIRQYSTCTEHGVMVYHCTVCGDELKSEEQALPLEPHKYVAEENYWQVEGYEAPDETRPALIPCKCSECEGDFIVKYDAAAFSSDKNIRLEDKYSAVTPIIFDSANKYLIINLAGGDTALAQLSSAGIYNSSDKVLTLPLSYNAIGLEKIEVIGFRTKRAGFSITTQVGSIGTDTVDIILQNISYTASAKTDGLNIDSINNVNLEVSGLVEIIGASGKAGISANNLNITGSGRLIVKGGDGTDGNSSGGHGTYGGMGIKANILTLALTGEVIVMGGNGGNAYDRPVGDNGGEGSSGRDGYSGGNGGYGINASEVKVISGTCRVVGGNGGNGGAGSECNRSEAVNVGSKHVTGGRGGDGGDGMTGVLADKIEITDGTLNATGGDGGNSGRAGGCHDDDHDGWVAFWGDTSAEDGEYGNAGSGGAGVSGTIEGGAGHVTTTDGRSGAVDTELNQTN